MKWVSSIAEGLPPEEALTKCLSEVQAEMKGAPVHLGILFVSPHYMKVYRDFPPRVLEGLGCDCLIGCSASGIIGGGKEVEHRAAVSLTAASLPGVRLKPFHSLMNGLPTLDSSPKAWQDWMGLSPADQPHFLLIADPLTFDPEGLLSGLDFAFPQSAKIGGLASGTSLGGENVLFLNEKLYSGGLVGLALHGNIAVDTIVAQGCRPIGEPLQVTRCHGNILLQLNGRSPIEVLQDLIETLGEEDRTLLQHSLFLGIVMDPLKDDLKQGDFLIRNILEINSQQECLAVGALLREGQTVQFHLRDAKTSAEDLDLMLSQYLVRHPSGASKGALLFSCLGRGAYLYGRPNHDTEVFRQKIGTIPVGGFFCNGEIGAVGDATFLHGYTSCFGIFRPERERTS